MGNLTQIRTWVRSPLGEGSGPNNKSPGNPDLAESRTKHTHIPHTYTRNTALGAPTHTQHPPRTHTHTLYTRHRQHTQETHTHTIHNTRTTHTTHTTHATHTTHTTHATQTTQTTQTTHTTHKPRPWKDFKHYSGSILEGSAGSGTRFGSPHWKTFNATKRNTL